MSVQNRPEQVQYTKTDGPVTQPPFPFQAQQFFGIVSLTLGSGFMSTRSCQPLSTSALHDSAARSLVCIGVQVLRLERI